MIINLIWSCKKVDFDSFDNSGKTVLLSQVYFEPIVLGDSSVEFNANIIIINDLEEPSTFKSDRIHPLPIPDILLNFEFIEFQFVDFNENLNYNSVLSFHTNDNKTFYDENIGFYLEQYLAESELELYNNHVQFAYFDHSTNETNVKKIDLDEFYHFKFSQPEGSDINVDINSYLEHINELIDNLIADPNPNSKHISLFNFSNLIGDINDSTVYNTIVSKLIDHNIKLNYFGKAPQYRINELVLRSGGFESISKRYFAQNQTNNVTEYIYDSNLALKSSNVTLQNFDILLRGNLPYYNLKFRLSGNTLDEFIQFTQQYKGVLFRYNNLEFYVPKLIP